MRRIEQILRFPRTDEEDRLAAEHIRAECERIQAGWSEHERATREAVGSAPLLVQEMAMREVVGARQHARG